MMTSEELNNQVKEHIAWMKEIDKQGTDILNQYIYEKSGLF
jgi:uncharacterized protein YnzC (UPF0291/DUF896 family)